MLKVSLNYGSGGPINTNLPKWMVELKYGCFPCKCVFVESIFSCQWDCCCHPVVPNREFRSCFLPQTPATLRGWKSQSSLLWPLEAPPTPLRGGWLCWRTRRCFSFYCDCVRFHVLVRSFQCFYPPPQVYFLCTTEVCSAASGDCSVSCKTGKIREEISMFLQNQIKILDPYQHFSSKGGSLRTAAYILTFFIIFFTLFCKLFLPFVIMPWNYTFVI